MRYVAVTLMVVLISLTSALAGSPDPTWVQRFDGPYHQDDRVVDMCIDDSGNVYVTGTSSDTIYNWSEIPHLFHHTDGAVQCRRLAGLGSSVW